MKKNYSGIIFDMDGLLFDTEALYRDTNLALAPAYGLKEYNEAYFLKYVGVSDEEMHGAYYHDFGYLGKARLDEFIEAGYEKVKQRFMAGEAKLKPGVVELLEHFKAQNVPCVVASSNLRSFIDILLEKAEIGHYFVDIVSSDDVARAKPDPEIVHKALGKLGVAAAEGLMLEDSFNGVKASHRAEVDVIMVPDLLQPTTLIKEKTVAVFSDLHEVKSYLEK